MKRTLGLLILLALAGVSCFYTPYGRTSYPPGYENGYGDDRSSDRYDDLDSAYFYNELQPHGIWVSYRPYGYVWVPGSVGYGWRPYTRGHWAWTDYGWTWVSNERWGWIVFHYGRWGWDTRLGWYWVPDYVWGPAWVAWRWGDAHIGWAPLPPGAGWMPGRGFDRGHRWDIPGRSWCFVRGRDFTDRIIDRWVLPYERNITIIELTRFEVNIIERDRRVVNEGLDVDVVRRQGNRTVERVALKDAGRPGPAREEGNEIFVAKPTIRPNETAKPRRVVDQDKAERDLGGESGPRVYRRATRNEEEAVREEHVQERQLMRESQETELTVVRRAAEEEQAKVQNPDEKRKVEARTTSRVAELKKKHEQEKADLEKRQKSEQEKAKKAPVRRKTGADKADGN